MSLGKEMKDKWIQALESGKYKQTAHTLKNDSGHCCLGVLCEIHPDLNIKNKNYVPIRKIIGHDVTTKLWQTNDGTFNPDKRDYSNVIPLIKEIVE